MTDQLEKSQLESTLYMPSMYDSEDDEEGLSVTDARDESTCSGGERIEMRRQNSRFSLMRCLAWSQAEDDIDDTRLSERKEEKDEDMFLIRITSGGCASFNSTHSALIDSTHYASDNNTKNVHWEERVASDKNLDSLLYEKKADSTFS